MGSFLRQPHARKRTRIFVPPVIPHDCDWEVMVSQEAKDAGEIWIEVDGVRQVTVLRDGTIAIHDDGPMTRESAVAWVSSWSHDHAGGESFGVAVERAMREGRFPHA